MATTTAGGIRLAKIEVRPPLRRLPAPIAEPPYDDERGGALTDYALANGALADSALADRPGDHTGSGGATQCALALAFSLPSGVPAHPTAPTGRLRLVAGPAATRVAKATRAPADDFGPRTTPARDLPSITVWAGRLVQALVEVLGGARSPSQLLRWTSREVYDAIVRHAPRPPHAARTALCGRAAAGTSNSTETRSMPPTVRSVRVCEPVDGVAEVCALIRQPGGRVRAIALRLEGVDGRWRCTALQVG